MSRYCGEINSAPILAAATYWRDAALLKDGSVFSEKSLWNLEGLKPLDQYFNQNPDVGEGTYWEKLRLQLQATSPMVKQLTAEMNWLMLLCPSNVTIDSKQKRIKQIWEWSGELLPPSASTLLNEAVLAGIGGAGSGFNNYRWRELRYCINFCLAFKQLPLPEREFLISDGWRFAQWLESLPESSSRQLRHMLMFLLFPENFERIFASRDRKAVAQAFSGLNPAEINVMEPVELDRILLRIRGELGEKYGTQELDYYCPPLKGLWGQPDFKATTQDITREHVLHALCEIDEGDVPVAAESTGYDLLHKAKRYPPKLVLSLASKHASGSEFDRSFFSGGESSQAFRVLRKLDFEIVPKAFIVELLNGFLAQAKAGVDLTVAGYPKNYRQLDVEISFGKGNFARIPWIAFLLPGQRPSKGVYPVLLFYREVKLLILAYGISEMQGARMTWLGLDNVQTVREFFREKFRREPDRYGESLVAAAFEIPGGLDLIALTQLLDEMIDRYKLLFREVHEPGANYRVPRERYSLDDALRGLFIPRQALSLMVDRLRRKKNLILKGPPGVGKTFVARRLAYALMGEEARDRVGMVQFHQAYSYEDFVQGYRPLGTGFQLKNGVFYEFCKKAQKDHGNDYVFVIDEVNRANLSKVFGELMMLVEGDKRSSEWAIPLTYSETIEDTFFLPPNLYIIGLMNTADRSLAMVDYALRRRFAFMDVEPGFETEQFSSFMRDMGVSESVIGRVIQNMRSLNDEISRDKANLGHGFCIGHSFFCSAVNASGLLALDWYQEIIRAEVLPLLSEYWFDDAKKLEYWEQRLLGE